MLEEYVTWWNEVESEKWDPYEKGLILLRGAGFLRLNESAGHWKGSGILTSIGYVDILVNGTNIDPERTVLEIRRIILDLEDISTIAIQFLIDNGSERFAKPESLELTAILMNGEISVNESFVSVIRWSADSGEAGSFSVVFENYSPIKRLD